MSSAVRRFFMTLRSTIFPLIGLMVLALPTLRAVDEVDVNADQAVAYRQGSINGEFTITRGGSASSVDVSFHMAGTAILGLDYNISIDGGPVISIPGAFIASMAAGVEAVTVTIIPLASPTTNPIGNPEGRVYADLVLDASGTAYSIGGSSQATVIIADNSMVATLTLPVSLASNDPALSSVAADPEALRRGVVRVELTPNPLPINTFRTAEVSIAGTAVLNTKYNLFWKVGGSDVGQGQGYLVTYYYNTSDSALGVKLTGNPVLEGDGLSFKLTDSAGTMTSYTGVYTGQSISSLTGPSVITGITPALAAPVLVGTDIKGTDTSTGQSVEFTVLRATGYPAGTTHFEVAGGVGIFSKGDLVSFGSTPGLYFIVTVPPTSQVLNGLLVWTLDISGQGGVIDSTATQTFASDGGIPIDVGLESSFLAEFPIKSSPSDVVIPPSSKQVEYSIEPTLGNPPTGAQTVILTMSQSYDYNMTTPTVGTVIIADTAVQANVTLGSNAGQPNTEGNFLLTFTQAFPTPINVPYTIFSDGNAAIPGTDYFPLTGILTVPAGQTSVNIPVVPISTDAILPAGGKDVGIILSGSLDYKLAGSGTTLTNPSATLNISPSLGIVGISSSSTVAYMNPSAPGLSNFTVSITRAASSTQAVIVNYTVGGSALQGVDYSPLTTATSSGYSTSGSVTIPAGQNSANVSILPIEDPISSGILQVVLTLTGGQGYTINPTNVSAVVNIQSDTPTLSVTAGTDASQPNTPGTFVVSYPGVPPGTALNHSLTVSYTLSGTGVEGKDYANPGTVTIPAGTNSVTVQISPSNNPLTVDKSVTFTINSASTYAIAANQGTATIALHFVTPPAAGSTTIGGGSATGGGQSTYSSSGGGCGVGGGLGLLVMALALSRRRR